ncbi:MHYT domain-containing protein [Dongia sp.]|uniref:MHYT domain-containing protein n=1 Tax=Dongia sp. TaxID=1977262 RepID=UPI0035B48B82
MINHLHTTHDPLIVLLSLLVAIVSSLVSLDVAERLRGARGRTWALWLAGAGCTLGGGIWSMHFIGMLAFDPPFEIRYDVGRTVISLLIAILSTALGYALIARRRSISWPKLALAGLVTGLGVAAMHYTGMSAIIAPASMHHDAGLVAVSILIAVAAATAAFWLSLKIDRVWHKLGASLLMGVAIAGMHYTAMAALYFGPVTHTALTPNLIGTPKPILAAALAIATILILAIGYMAAIGDRRFDLRARRDAERQLRSERRFETVVSASSNIVFLLDEAGRIAYESPSTQRVLGFGRGSLLGTPLEELIPAENKPYYQNLITRILTASGESVEVEMPFQAANGSVIFADLAVTNLLGDPHLRALVVKLHDVTEKKRITEELRAAKERAEASNRVKSTFLANVSHELRTPLNAIIGFSDLLIAQTKGPLQQAYMEFARDINDGGKTLLDLVNRTLDFSQAEAGTVRIESVPLDPMVEAAVIIRNHAREIAEKSISISSEPFTAPVRLMADQGKFRQILNHLLSNALKFTEQGGRIDVSAEIDVTGSLVVAVQDNGRGMGEDEVAQALLPFGKGNAGLNRTFDGVGLGLATCNALMGLHDGRIIIESARGVGTLVILKFPPSRVVPAESPEPAEADLAAW